MEDTISNASNVVDQASDQRHRTQSLLQIWLPLGSLVLLVAGLFIAIFIVAQRGTTNLGQVQDAAIILMILPLVFIGLLTFISIGLAIVTTSRISLLLPKLRVVSRQLNSLSSTVTTWSNRVMLPFVLISGLHKRISTKKNKQLTD
jgi:amino acid transporter